MKLYVNRPSPYGRKTIVAALESGLADQIEIVQVDPWIDPPELLSVTPAGRVPALVLDDHSVLLESTAICAQLFDAGGRPHQSGTEKLDEARRTGFAQALIDAGYGIVIERRRPPEKQWDQWVERQERAIDRLLEAVEAPALDRFDIGDISLACSLAYLDFRLPQIDWRDVRPELAAWLDDVARRPSMTASAPGG
jgi:glutathione S-transferase